MLPKFIKIHGIGIERWWILSVGLKGMFSLCMFQVWQIYSALYEANFVRYWIFATTQSIGSFGNHLISS